MRRLGLACLAVFAVINVAVTSVELIAGRPISDLLTGKKASGTSLFGTHSTGGGSTPSTTTTVTVTPSRGGHHARGDADRAAGDQHGDTHRHQHAERIAVGRVHVRAHDAPEGAVGAS